MSTHFEVETTSRSDGPLLSFGPVDPETKRQLAIPATFERSISDPERGLRITLSCAFIRNTVEVNQLVISSNGAANISSRAIAQLGLPALIRAVTSAVVPNWEYWIPSKKGTEILDSSKSNFAFLAQVYWLEHISQGRPRQALMDLLSMPRSSCNVLLREIRKYFELPVTE